MEIPVRFQNQSLSVRRDAAASSAHPVTHWGPGTSWFRVTVALNRWSRASGPGMDINLTSPPDSGGPWQHSRGLSEGTKGLALR
jgi:hypothetical protein